jgi:hypothetical protein
MHIRLCLFQTAYSADADHSIHPAIQEQAAQEVVAFLLGSLQKEGRSGKIETRDDSRLVSIMFQQSDSVVC